MMANISVDEEIISPDQEEALKTDFAEIREAQVV